MRSFVRFLSMLPLLSCLAAPSAFATDAKNSNVPVDAVSETYSRRTEEIRLGYLTCLGRGADLVSVVKDDLVKRRLLVSLVEECRKRRIDGLTLESNILIRSRGYQLSPDEIRKGVDEIITEWDGRMWPEGREKVLMKFMEDLQAPSQR